MSSPGNNSSVIRVQLDYFMSSQFAGVAVALQDKLYSKAGLTVEVLPNVDPGEEPAAVLEAQKQTPGAVCVGTIEQNVLFPCVVENGAKVTAVAAMFGRSPLCLASLKDGLTAHHVASTQGEGLTIGAHVDTVDLLQRIVPKSRVLGVARDEKLTLLASGDIDAVQVYDVMEPLALEAKFGKPPAVLPLNSCTKGMMELGYSQVVFVPTSLLHDDSRQASLKKFLEVTFAGWKQAIADPKSAAKAVMALQPTEVDHWVEDLKFTEKTVERCNDYVKMSRLGPSLGVIDPTVWETANKWLAGGSKAKPDASRYPPLDNSIWGVDPRLMVGDGLARDVINGVRRKVQVRDDESK